MPENNGRAPSIALELVRRGCDVDFAEAYAAAHAHEYDADQSPDVIAGELFVRVPARFKGKTPPQQDQDGGSYFDQLRRQLAAEREARQPKGPSGLEKLRRGQG